MTPGSHPLAHWRYLRYVLRHKWLVLLAGLRFRVPLWQLLAHDLSKFSRAEWGPYVRYFHGPVRRDPSARAAFDGAWQHHQRANPHHWQHWLARDAAGAPSPREMPDRYVREMVADWIAAGQGAGKPDIRGWYARNRERKLLHPATRARVEALLACLPRPRADEP